MPESWLPVLDRLRHATSLARSGRVIEGFQSLVSPVKYIASANLACTGLAFLVGLFTMRILGAEMYGVVAVVGAANSAVVRFLDVRLTDLAGKLYYQQDLPHEVGRDSYRSSVIQICLAGNALISVLSGVLGLLVTMLLIHLFTSSPVRVEWMVAQSAVLAAETWVQSFVFLQRFGGRFYLLGSWKFITQVCTTIAFLAVLIAIPTLDGYYLGLVLITFLNLGMWIGLDLFTWTRLDGLPIFSVSLAALHGYRLGLRFLFFGNLLGYASMFQRSVDVLLVGFFADDRATGLYRFARQLCDGLLVLYSAMNQVYYPRFLELLAHGRQRDFRALAARLLAGNARLMALLLVAQGLFLPAILGIALAGRFEGAEGPIIVVSLTFFANAGFHIWMWPLLVHSGRLGVYTIVAYAGCAVQYVLTAALCVYVGPTAMAGAIGYLSYYLTVFPLTFLLLRKWYPEAVPGGRTDAVPA